MGSRHTMFFMDKEYPNIPMGGGSGGGGGGEATELFTNQTTTNPATITFDEPITNYDFIMFQTRAGENAVATMTYNTANLVAGNTIGAGFYTGVFAWYYYTDSQTLTFRVSAGGGYISNITGIKLSGGSGGGGGTGGINYSTEEQEIGTWIDGSKLYQKTVHTGALSGNSSGYHFVTVADSNCEIVDISGYWVDNSGWFLPFTIPWGSSGWIAVIMNFGQVSGAYAKVRGSIGIQNTPPVADGVMTIRYIKVTS